MELGIFTGKPRFEYPLHVGKPNIGNKERFKQRVDEIFTNGWLTNDGPFVKKFESEVASHLDVENFISVCNGTMALELAIRALGLSGEVIVPSFTFIAIPHTLFRLGIKPVFVDIDPNDLNISIKNIEALINSQTTGMIAVHTWGRPCDIKNLENLANQNNLKLIFDASHAFSVTSNGKKIGNFGDAEIFSFHATKFINSFEGGGVTTNNDDTAEKVRLMRNFGFAGMDYVVSEGTNGKMSEINAAMGLTSLESVDQFREVNMQNYNRYRKRIESINGIIFLEYDTNTNPNYQYITIEVDSEDTILDRDEIISILHAENVIARRYFYPGCHKSEPYKSLFKGVEYNLPVTEEKVKLLICLPTGNAIGKEEIDGICDVLDYSITNSLEIAAMLRSEDVKPVFEDRA